MMGNGLGFRCNKCGHEFTASFGIGFMFPVLYRETVKEIRQGKYGREWKELFKTTPGAAVNAEMELYVCGTCGCSVNDLNLAIYEPKKPRAVKIQDPEPAGTMQAKGREYVMPYELKSDYRLVELFIHKCPECGKRMHKYRETDRLKCPECRTGWMEETDSILWD